MQNVMCIMCGQSFETEEEVQVHVMQDHQEKARSPFLGSLDANVNEAGV